jgi:hypothetical protein
MALRAKDEATPRELIPARTYLAVIQGIVDLGTQESPQYGSDHKVMFLFELHTRKGPAADKDGRQLVANREFALKFSKIQGRTPAALRIALETLEGREFTEAEARDGVNLEPYLGRACKVVVKHVTKNGKTYDNLDAILALDEDDEAPDAELDDLYYEVDPSGPIPDAVPKWIARKIQRSREWVAIHGPAEGQGSGSGQGQGQGDGRQPANAGARAGAPDNEDAPF